MIPLKGILTCCGYDDLLRHTLHVNARHLTEVVVVTSFDDHKTEAVVADVPNARCFKTDAFYRNGAKFNKGAAIEEGFDALGREGWILIFDADVVFPDSLPLDNLNPAKLYGARRRMMDDPRQYTPGLKDWRKWPLSSQGGWPGYFQLFHAACPVIAQRPWYDVTYTHAGMSDNYFQLRWPSNQKEWLPLEVLHLGPRDRNWYGRVTPRLDGEAIPEATERAQNMRTMMMAKGWGGFGPRTRNPQFSEKIVVSEPASSAPVSTTAIKDGPDTLHIPDSANSWLNQGGEFRWVSIRDLAGDAVRLASKLPPHVSGIAGIPRSGMIPAAAIATILHLPLYQLTETGKLDKLGHGSRGNTGSLGKTNGLIAVVDDVVYAGASMDRARTHLKGRPALFCSVYAKPDAKDKVDLFAAELPSPFLLEWNLLNNGPFIGAARNKVFGSGIVCDFDGIICHDEHSPGQPGSPYLLPRLHPCKLIATGRRESQRGPTEAWLKAHGVRFDRLEMLPNSVEGTTANIAAHKARHLVASGCGFMLESCPTQAAEIAALSAKPVICPIAGKVFT